LLQQPEIVGKGRRVAGILAARSMNPSRIKPFSREVLATHKALGLRLVDIR
jgi:hypothetical protein